MFMSLTTPLFLCVCVCLCEGVCVRGKDRENEDSRGPCQAHVSQNALNNHGTNQH